MVAQNRTIILDIHAGCLQSLLYSALFAYYHSRWLPCGFHFGGEVGIHAVQLGEGEGGNLYIPSLLSSGYRPKMPCSFSVLPRITSVAISCQRIACCLEREGNRSGGTRVYLDNVYVILLIHDELDIEQTDDANAKTQLLVYSRILPLALLDTEKVGYTEMESPE